MSISSSASSQRADEAGEPIRVTRRQAAVTILALLHLLSVAVFIWTDYPEGAEGAVASAMRTYSNLSGTFRDYTFFAPAVASDTKAGFLIEDASGESRFVNFSADNHEVALRYNNIVASAMRDERGRDLFAQSLAAFWLSEEEAAQVTVVARMLVVPSMAAYRAGERPQWETIYFGVFGRRDSAGQ